MIKNKVKTYFLAAVLAALSVAGTACAKGETNMKDTRNLTAQEYTLMNLTGTDALGRTIPVGNIPKIDKDRFVGIFYTLWHGQHPSIQKDIYNISRLLRDHPDDLWNTEGTPLSPLGEFHYVDEPLWGYYDMRDPWVVNKQIKLLTSAGIDYLLIDATNAQHYPQAAYVLLDILLQYQDEGWKVPQVVFYTNAYSGTVAESIYDSFYDTDKPEYRKYDTLWFRGGGLKPWIVGITEKNDGASDVQSPVYMLPALKQFFHVKESQWPFGKFNADGLPWTSWDYPQFIHNEGIVNVSVAQQSFYTSKFSDMYKTSSRGYNRTTETVEQDWQKGQNFQGHWDSVFKREDLVSNVLVCSWNEWMAIKFVDENPGRNGEKTYFVDVFNNEYSRDIEMDKGAYGDNFYMQLMQNVRRFKNEEMKSYELPDYAMSGIADKNWAAVKTRYLDIAGAAMARDFQNAVNTGKYTDNSNRNDIEEIKVAHDNKNLYFLIKTKDGITAYNGTDSNWMNLFIGIQDSAEKSFEHFQYAVNRTPAANGTTSVERSTGGFAWKSAGTADYTVSGNTMMITVPLSAIGLDTGRVKLTFKVSDNVTDPSDIMSYYTTGDCAPIGRLSYAYGY